MPEEAEESKRAAVKRTNSEMVPEPSRLLFGATLNTGQRSLERVKTLCARPLYIHFAHDGGMV